MGISPLTPDEGPVTIPPRGEIPAPTPWRLDEVVHRPAIVVRASLHADHAWVTVLHPDPKRLQKFVHDARRVAQRQGSNIRSKRFDGGVQICARK